MHGKKPTTITPLCNPKPLNVRYLFLDPNVSQLSALDQLISFHKTLTLISDDEMLQSIRPGDYQDKDGGRTCRWPKERWTPLGYGAVRTETGRLRSAPVEPSEPPLRFPSYSET